MAESHVKDTISTKHNGWRFVATGKKVHYAKNWKIFTDFLGAYLAGCLGKKWCDRQVKLPVEQQHPIVQWHSYIAYSQQGLKPNDRGLYGDQIGRRNRLVSPCL